MGEEKWMRRKPGRASGTVVPPPVGDDPPPLPERRNPGRTRHRLEGSPRGHTQPPVPEMPDNVRLLFQPVLRPSEGGTGNDGRAVEVSPARRGAGPARAGSAATTQVLPSSRLQNPESGAGPGLANAGSSAAAGSLASPGGGPYTDVMDPVAIGPQATRGVRHQRRTAGRRTVARPGYRRHLVWMAALTVLLLLTAAGTTVALLRQHGGGNPAAGGGGGGTALAGAAASRAAAARWVSREVSRSDIIGCDSVMCGALVKSGVPSADLLAVTPTTQDPLQADVLVATPALQSQFGSRLSTEYAPAVLASFGTGNARVDVRVVAAYGASAYQLALNRDLAARELLGTQLVGNNRIA